MDKHSNDAGRYAEQRHQLESRDVEARFARQAPGRPDPMPTIPREPRPAADRG